MSLHHPQRRKQTNKTNKNKRPPLLTAAGSRNPDMLAPRLRHRGDPGARADDGAPGRAQEGAHDGAHLHARHRAHRAALQREPRVQQHGVPVPERGLHPDAQGGRARGRAADGVGLARRGAVAGPPRQRGAHRGRRRPRQRRRDRLQLARLPLPARRHRLRGPAPRPDPAAALARRLAAHGPARQPLLLRPRLRPHELPRRPRLRVRLVRPRRPLPRRLRPAAAQRPGGLSAQREQRLPGSYLSLSLSLYTQNQPTN